MEKIELCPTVLCLVVPNNSFFLLSFLPSFYMLHFHTTQLHLLVSGNTFPIKQILKHKGGLWKATTKTWFLPLAMDGEVFRCCLRNCEDLTGKEPIVGEYDLRFWTERANKMAMLSILAKKRQEVLDTDFWWICCERCEVKNWSRQLASCACHH